MTWTDAPQLEARVQRALDSFNRPEAQAVATESNVS